MDIIFLHKILAETTIGLYDFERAQPQILEIDLKIALPNPNACYSDNIDDTIHYGLVVTKLRQALCLKHFLLLEALAEYVAHLIRSEFSVPWIEVCVAKPGALPGVKRVGVCITRGVLPVGG